jgi:hypothetical protein
MNAHYIIFNRDTGEIIQSIYCQETVLDNYTRNGELGAIAVEGVLDPSKFHVVNGTIEEYELVGDVSYREQRMYAYPSVSEQLDSLWHAMDQGILPKIEPMYSQVKAVKTGIPKVK